MVQCGTTYCIPSTVLTVYLYGRQVGGGPAWGGQRPSLTQGRCTKQDGSGRENKQEGDRQEDQEERVHSDRQAKGETKGTVQEGSGQGGQGGGGGQTKEELRKLAP